MLSSVTMRDLQQSNVIPSCFDSFLVALLSPGSCRMIFSSPILSLAIWCLLQLLCVIFSSQILSLAIWCYPQPLCMIFSSPVLSPAIWCYPQLFWFFPCCFAISGQLSHMTPNYLVLSPSHFPISPSSYQILSQTILCYPATNIYHLQAAIICYSQLSHVILPISPYNHAIFNIYMLSPALLRISHPNFLFHYFLMKPMLISSGVGGSIPVFPINAHLFDSCAPFPR